MKRQQLDLLGAGVFLVLALALFFVGIQFIQNYNFADSNVRDQLKAEKIFFPAKDKLKPDEKKQPDVVKYAGQQVDDGNKAQVYADDFIALHLRNTAGGQTYSEVSAASQANPQDQKLASQAQTLFRGESLRGLLLTTYAFWTLGQKARTAAIWMFIAAAVVFILSLGGFWHAWYVRRHPAGS